MSADNTNTNDDGNDDEYLTHREMNEELGALQRRVTGTLFELCREFANAANNNELADDLADLDQALTSVGLAPSADERPNLSVGNLELELETEAEAVEANDTNADERHTESGTDLSALRPAGTVGNSSTSSDDLPSSGSLAEYREQQANTESESSSLTANTNGDGRGLPATRDEHLERKQTKRKQPSLADIIGE